MSGRKYTIAVIASSAALLVGVTSWVTADAVSTSSGVRGCQTAKGYLTLPTSAGHCPAGSTGVTIGQRGPAGPAGVADARIETDYDGGRTLLPGTESHHGVIPRYSDAATTKKLPAGSYLISATVILANDGHNGGGPLTCSVSGNAQAAQGASGFWQQNLAPSEVTTATVLGGLTLDRAATVSITCLNASASSIDVIDSAVVVTPVTHLSISARCLGETCSTRPTLSHR